MIIIFLLVFKSCAQAFRTIYAEYDLYSKDAIYIFVCRVEQYFTIDQKLCSFLFVYNFLSISQFNSAANSRSSKNIQVVEKFYS